MRHHAKRRDANEAAIVRALETVGASVERLDGDGVPDLLVGYRGVTHLLEVKNPDATGGAKDGGVRTKGRGYLRPAQIQWFRTWLGAPVHEVVSIEEALLAIGAERALL